MNPTIKRYAVSSAITFLTVFSATLAMQLKAGLPADLTVSAILALLGVAARAAWKAAIEYVIALFVPPQA